MRKSSDTPILSAGKALLQRPSTVPLSIWASIVVSSSRTSSPDVTVRHPAKYKISAIAGTIENARYRQAENI
jgi:hypothetical protein